MKRCSFCGRQHDDSTDVCNECGSPIVSTEVELAIKGPCREPDEIPTPPLAQKEGNAITLRCRTPGEAYLVKDELEQSDIVTILPEDKALYLEYKRNGYVEIRVSAKAYSSIPDL